jgi:CRISPR-associated protein Cas2
MVMRAKKNFIVVAYDVADDRRRAKVVKVLEKVGVRVNFSVFECMLTDSQYQKVQTALEKVICLKEDRIIYYPICVDCYSKIVYQPKNTVKYERVVVI